MSNNAMKTIMAGTVSAAPIVGYDNLMTLDTFNNYVLFNGTIGFWLAIGGGVSLFLIILLNLVKLYKELRDIKKK